MTRFWSIILFVVAFAVACDTSDESVASQPEEAFMPILLDMSINDSDTKATLIKEDADVTSVGVYCAYTGSTDYIDYSTTSSDIFNKMENMKYSDGDSDGVWSSDTPVQWGFNNLYEKYTFFAYSPYSDTDTEVIDGELFVNHTTAESVTDQIDLLIAQPQKDIYPQVGNNIMLTLDHALSAIAFRAKCEDESEDYVINSITLSGVIDSGSATHDGTSVVWSLGSGSSEFASGLKSSDDYTLSESEATLVTANDGYLMLIPQSLENITVKINNGEETLFNLGTTTESEWEPSNIYTYTFILSDTGVTLDPSVSVKTWSEGSINSSYDKDNFPLPAENCINLDYYDNVDKLKLTLEKRLDDGITEFLFYGTYFDGIFSDVIDGSESSNLNISNSTASTNSMLIRTTSDDGKNTYATSLDLSRVELNDTTISLPDGAFYGSEHLVSIILPDDISVCGSYAFAECTELVDFEAKDLSTIGDYSFYNCSDLNYLNLPEATTIGTHVFSGCTSLYEIYLPSAISIGESCFRYTGRTSTQGSEGGATIYLTKELYEDEKIKIAYDTTSSDQWYYHTFVLDEETTLDEDFVVASSDGTGTSMGYEFGKGEYTSSDMVYSPLRVYYVETPTTTLLSDYHEQNSDGGLNIGDYVISQAESGKVQIQTNYGRANISEISGIWSSNELQTNYDTYPTDDASIIYGRLGSGTTYTYFSDTAGSVSVTGVDVSGNVIID